jgi:intracellular sulfur oxidation DsrE/DsrF family protein
VTRPDMIDRQLLIHAYGDTPAVVATALRSARNAAAELGSDVSVHVVVQGPAVRELADQSDLSGELEESILDPRVVVLACRNSLRTAGLESTDLLPGVQTVPSAVAYLAERQWNGSAYVRV